MVEENRPPEDRSNQGFTLWFTGLSGSGKSTIAQLVRDALEARGRKVEVLDGDEVRQHLSKGLGFSKEDRDINVKRIAWVASLLTRHQAAVITAAISPYRETREWARQKIGNFVEVYVSCPLEVCAERDVKGLYAKAMAGEIPQFTGVSDPYEPPLNPELIVETHRETPNESAAKVIHTLESLGYLPAEDPARSPSAAHSTSSSQSTTPEMAAHKSDRQKTQ